MGAAGPERTVGETGEDRLVAELISRYSSADWLLVGPGDDAAVLDLCGAFPGQLVVSTDTLVEGHDFRRSTSSARDVGIKTAAQNFADIAAMGAYPRALLVSLATPADVPASWAAELADGLAAECERAGAVVVGGDLSAGAQLVVTGTAIGTLGALPAVLRSGASGGDVVAIAGRSGRSAAGLALLERGFGRPAGSGPELSDGSSEGSSEAAGGARGEAIRALIGEHRRPCPPYEAGPQAAMAGASAMIDTSDGLLRDAQRLARASGVILDLESALLLPDADLVAAAAVLGEVDPLAWVLTGGEDHALLACFPPTAELPAAFRRIGAVRALPADARTRVETGAGAGAGAGAGVGASAGAGGGAAARAGVVLVDGVERVGPGGWQHFAAAERLR